MSAMVQEKIEKRILKAAVWQSQLNLDIIINFVPLDFAGKRVLFSNIIQNPWKLSCCQVSSAQGMHLKNVDKEWEFRAELRHFLYFSKHSFIFLRKLLLTWDRNLSVYNLWLYKDICSFEAVISAIPFLICVGHLNFYINFQFPGTVYHCL